MRTRTKASLAGVALLALALPVLAGVVEEGYRILVTAPTEYRSVADGAEDTNDPTTIVDGQDTNGNPTVIAQWEFTTSGATVFASCELYDSSNTWQGTAWIGTITASTSRRLGTSYIPDAAATFVDTGSARQYDWRILDVSTGTVTLRSWTSGAHPDAAD